MYKVYSILTSLDLSVVTASRTLHPTPFKSCVFFLASVFLLLPLLRPSTVFVQSEIALFQCYSNQQSQCDHRQELVIDFCKIFGLFFVVVVVFFNLFKCETFFLVNLKSLFYFQYFSAFLLPFLFHWHLFKYHFHFFLHPQAFTKIQRSIDYNLTYSTIKLIQPTVKPKPGQRQVSFNKT